MRAPAFLGRIARGRDALADHRGGLAVRLYEFTGPHGVHLDAQVDPVDQRAGQLAEIPPLFGTATDAVLGLAGAHGHGLAARTNRNRAG